MKKKEDQAVRDILLWMDARRRRQLETAPSKVHRAYEVLRGEYRELNESALERLLARLVTTGKGDFLPHGYLYLEPFDKGGWCLPILSLMYDSSGVKPVV